MTSPTTRAHLTCDRSGRKPLSNIDQMMRRCTGFESVADIGQRPRHDDRHGIVEERLLHLGLDLDRLDVDTNGAVVVTGFFGCIGEIVIGGITHAVTFAISASLRFGSSAES